MTGRRLVLNNQSIHSKSIIRYNNTQDYTETNVLFEFEHWRIEDISPFFHTLNASFDEIDHSCLLFGITVSINYYLLNNSMNIWQPLSIKRRGAYLSCIIPQEGLIDCNSAIPLHSHK